MSETPLSLPPSSPPTEPILPQVSSIPTPTPPALSVEEIYHNAQLTEAELAAIFDESLYPRPASMLYSKMGKLGLGESHWLLDIGCRDAQHTMQLVQRYRCHAVGIDPVDDHVANALVAVAAHDLRDRLTVSKGRIEALPGQNGRFDFIWCRDVLNHITDLRKGLQECFRVLRPGGHMLIYQTFATNLLEPAEAVRLYLPLAIVPTNMSHDYFESIAQRVGFQIVEKDLVGSEWREYWEEDGTRTTSTQLLHLARLRRRRDAYINKVGRTVYEVELANCFWGIYQMLGKLCPTVYILTKPRPR